MLKITLLALMPLLFSECASEEEGYKWREEWKEESDVTPEDPEDPQDPSGNTDITIVGKPRYVWIDAAASFQYYANDAEYIAADCARIAEMGFTDIIVDVRPTSGDVLFQSSVAPACTKVAAWVKGGYRYVERTATFDYLATFIEQGHKAGLRVNAALNTMVGGYKSTLGEVGMLYDRPELRSWGAVDNLSTGLVNTLDDPDTGPRFLDPANPEVQEFLLTMLGEVAAYPGLDGIVLDRCRFDDYCMNAGYTDAAKAGFAAFIGNEPSRWPIFDAGTEWIPSSPSTVQKQWCSFRAKVIHDFVEKAAEKVHTVAPKLRFGVYVGAWFSEYYRSGVNWASPSYNVKSKESTYKWVDATYQKYGFADHLDFIFLGAYAAADKVYGSGEWTMEGFAKLGAKRLAGDVPFAAGPDIGNATGFPEGGREDVIPDIVSAMLESGDGLFIFDLCHIRMYDYWSAFKAAIDTYLNAVNSN